MKKRHLLRSWIAGLTAAVMVVSAVPVYAESDSYFAETKISVSSTEVTIAQGESAQIHIDPIDRDQVDIVLKTTGSSAKAVLDDSEPAPSLTVTGTKEGRTLCTILLKDLNTGVTKASKTISVTTTDQIAGSNENASLKFSASELKIAAGGRSAFYVRVLNPDGDFYLDAAWEYGGMASFSENEWDDGGTRKKFVITGNTPGDDYLNLTLRDTATNRVIQTKSIPVHILKKGTILCDAKPAVTRTKYSDVGFSILSRPSGSTYSVSVSKSGYVKTALVKKAWSSGTVRIRGLKKGKVNVVIKLTGSDGTEISRATIPVTIKDTGVIDYAFDFYNSSEDFGYPAGYLIPLVQYQRMFGKNARASRLKTAIDQTFGWGGNCFGMSAVSGIIYNQNLAGSFRSGAFKAYDLSLASKSSYSGLSIKSFIESMHISQYSETVVALRGSRSNYGTNYEVSDRIVSLAKQGILTLIDLWGWESGHTVLAYKASVSGNTAKVYVYDPNYSNTPRYITFYKTDDGHYEAFDYYINDYDPVQGIDYVTYNEYAKGLWSKRGTLVPGSSYFTSLLTSTSENIDVLSSDGHLAASVRDGEIETADAGVNQIKGTDQVSSNGVMLYLPKDSYTIRNCSGTGEAMYVTLTDTDRSAGVTTTAEKATLIASDEEDAVGALIDPEEGSEYEIELISTDTDDPQEILVSGTAEEEPITASYDEGVFASNGQIVEGIEETEEMTADPAYVHATDFAFRLLDASVSDKGDNILLSPYSMLSALAMAGNGADGETAAQFRQVLAGGESLDTLNSVLSIGLQPAEEEAVTEASSEAEATDTETESDAVDAFHSASSIWLNSDSGADFRESYLEEASQNFNAELFAESFDETALEKINTWTSDHTAGMIPNLLDNLNPSLTAMLINASVFDSKWAVPYEAESIYENRVFKAADGSSEEVTMMAGEEDTYLTLNGSEGFTKPYENSRYAFFALLPEQGTSPEDLIAGITSGDFTKAYQNAQKRTVRAMIPAFTQNYSAEMQDALTKLGLTDAFSDAADFSKMSETSFRFDSVIHKTYISVDSNGTKAAAATAIGLKTTAALDPDAEKPVTVILDRPFVYGILDSETGVPLFIGIQNHVN